MLKGRNEFEKYLESQIIKVIANNEICKKICDYANEIYNIPKSLVSDYITMRLHLSQASEFILFCLNDSLEKAIDNNKTVVDKYFTMQEVKTYRISKYEVDEIKFPLKFKVIQINDDQWIGRVDVKFLILLRKSQMINYNINAQRNLTRIVHGDKEIYKITVNNHAVNEIKKSIISNEFISNTITLNIPYESESEFYYDKDSSELIINKLDAFHIPDGFHRLLSLYQAYDQDENFNYDMELRITHWDDDKARTFIWQENKRTPIKKIHAESLNMNQHSNIIVERINNSVYCNMKGLIGRNGSGLIDFGEFSELINWFYIKGEDKDKINKIQLNTIRELIDDLNILTESNVKYLEEKWDYNFLLAFMCVCKYCNDNSIDKKDICRITETVYDKILKSNDKKFNNKNARKVLIDTVMGFVKESV